jgi:hypothetical protein
MPGWGHRRGRADAFGPLLARAAVAMTLLCMVGLPALTVASTLLDVAAQGLADAARGLEEAGSPWQGIGVWLAERLWPGGSLTPAALHQRADRLRELAGAVAIVGLLAALCAPARSSIGERDGCAGQRPAASTMSNGAA